MIYYKAQIKKNRLRYSEEQIHMYHNLEAIKIE